VGVFSSLWETLCYFAFFLFKKIKALYNLVSLCSRHLQWVSF